MRLETLIRKNRMFDSKTGRFLRRDLIGYGDGPALYQYGASNPAQFNDSLGLSAGLGMYRAMQVAKLSRPIEKSGIPGFGPVHTLTREVAFGGNDAPVACANLGVAFGDCGDYAAYLATGGAVMEGGDRRLSDKELRDLRRLFDVRYVGTSEDLENDVRKVHLAIDLEHHVFDGYKSPDVLNWISSTGNTLAVKATMAANATPARNVRQKILDARDRLEERLPSDADPSVLSVISENRVLGALEAGVIGPMIDTTAGSLFDYGNIVQLRYTSKGTGILNLGLKVISDLDEEFTDINLLVVMLTVSEGDIRNDVAYGNVVRVLTRAGGFRRPGTGQTIGLTPDAVRIILKGAPDGVAELMYEALDKSNERYPQHPYDTAR